MGLQILWQRDCPGYLETEIINGVIQVTCLVEEAPPPARVTDGLQLLYTFEENGGTIINDVSGVGAPFNLIIESEAAVSWIPGGGLSVDSPTIIASGDPATKVIEAVKASNEITLESWVKPANRTQDGPARIIVLSSDYHHRNLQLAQAGSLYDVRLRTTQTTDNGQPSLFTPLGSLTTGLTHVLYTFQTTGEAVIYINGEPVASKLVGGDLSNWNEEYRMALANEMIGSRGWLGKFHLVAIYDRALSSDEVVQNFEAGVHT
jgi:hypothetical protein